ncbi:AMP-binding protein [Blastococcus saxobsidens]|uniref:Putative AMP-dependent synthetase and ligase n=1 Tax=Blastococcus saxobsidens (strain DD2) TaxID=1146883 RepID=H6RN35_BLASD|nr:class I adenylate-forming enzyme family protein [Blastococcus saxobsidens]CCG01388.1 putative AMP-dependent synthetase and ligase [Blastococcus saxobsidens DD2]
MSADPQDTARSGAGPAIIDRDGAVLHAELRQDPFGLRRIVPRGAVVALQAHRARTVAAALCVLEGRARRVDLIGSLGHSVEPGTITVDDAAVGTESAAEDDEHAGEAATDQAETRTRWRLFTSGTTGEPKPVDHTLRSLSRTVRVPGTGGRTQRRWGLLYEPTRMAGLQVLLQALASEDVLVDASGHGSLPDRLQWLADNSVDTISATPTIWRQVLQSQDPRALPLTQITLGGEIADQRLLDALRRTFPEARITHIFASTDTGAAFAVNDGREGFPRAYLESAPSGVRLDVRDGRLFVEAPEVSGAGPDGFVDTGDLVEMTADRIRILGRASGAVNVGGVLVSPEQVESVLRAHPDVVDAVVTSRRNAFSGNILVADVLPTSEADTRALPAALRAEVASRLSSVHVPASVKVVPEMVVTSTGKVGRR